MTNLALSPSAESMVAGRWLLGGCSYVAVAPGITRHDIEATGCRMDDERELNGTERHCGVRADTPLVTEDGQNCGLLIHRFWVRVPGALLPKSTPDLRFLGAERCCG